MCFYCLKALVNKKSGPAINCRQNKVSVKNDQNE